MTNSNTTFEKRSDAPMGAKGSLGSRSMVGAITLYQRLTSGRISPCRFYPSCSNYAVEAIESHGVVKGSLLALRRLSRCRPLGPHGVDLVPVPTPKKARSSQR